MMSAQFHPQAFLSGADCPAHQPLSQQAAHDSSWGTSRQLDSSLQDVNKLQTVTDLTALQLSQILSRLQELREHISAAENLVALELDHRRNQLFTFRVVRKDNPFKHSMAGSLPSPFLPSHSQHGCLEGSCSLPHALAAGTSAAATCDGLHAK